VASAASRPLQDESPFAIGNKASVRFSANSMSARVRTGTVDDQAECGRVETNRGPDCAGGAHGAGGIGLWRRSARLPPHGGGGNAARAAQRRVARMASCRLSHELRRPPIRKAWEVPGLSAADVDQRRTASFRFATNVPADRVARVQQP